MSIQGSKTQELDVYSLGICTASICTTLSIEEAEKQMNIQEPTGISSPWRFARDEKFFVQGRPNPCDCENGGGRKHMLFHC